MKLSLASLSSSKQFLSHFYFNCTSIGFYYFPVSWDTLFNVCVCALDTAANCRVDLKGRKAALIIMPIISVFRSQRKCSDQLNELNTASVSEAKPTQNTVQ